jgi:hypothetical protein
MEIIKYFLFIVLLGFFGFFYKKSKVNLVAFIAFLLPFPISIELFGRDSFTITSFLIILLFVIESINKRIKYNVVTNFQLCLIAIYIFSFFISLFSLKNSELFESIRWVIYYLSSIMLFFLFCSIVKNPIDVYKIINVLLISFVIQVLISILILKNSNLMIFKVFMKRTQISVLDTVGDISRVSGLIGDYELFGEFCALLAFYALWMFFVLNKKKFLFFFLMLFFGAVLTVTRSVIILFPIGIFFLFILANSTVKIKLILAIGCISILVSISSNFIFESRAYKNINNRLETTKQDVKYKNVSFLEIIGRQEVQGADRYVVNFIGSGKKFKNIESLHSLYLTLINQSGLLGFSSYILFLLSLFFSILSKWYNLINLNNFIFYNEALFASIFSLLTLSLLFINEFKVEHLRFSHTTEFIWLIYAISNMTIYFNKNYIKKVRINL